MYIVYERFSIWYIISKLACFRRIKIKIIWINLLFNINNHVWVYLLSNFSSPINVKKHFIAPIMMVTTIISLEYFKGMLHKLVMSLSNHHCFIENKRYLLKNEVVSQVASKEQNKFAYNGKPSFFTRPHVSLLSSRWETFICREKRTTCRSVCQCSVVSNSQNMLVYHFSWMD